MSDKVGAKRGWLVVLPLVLILAGTAAAAQFSATMVLRDSGKEVLGKIFVQDGKLRQEFDGTAGQTVTIVRPDLKKVWILIPQRGSFTELPLRPELPGQFIQIPPGAQSKRPLGKETVDGYEAEKYQVIVRQRSGPEVETIWVATKLGVPVKLVSKGGRFSVEYQNIKEGPQPESLFSLPPEYTRVK